MAMLRCFILLLLSLVSSGAGYSSVAHGSKPGASATGCIKSTSDKSKEWDGQQSQLPLATLQEAEPMGYVGVRPQRYAPVHSNVLTRGSGKSVACLTSKCLDKARRSCGTRQESAPFSISVSSDYYVIALRHIIR